MVMNCTQSCLSLILETDHLSLFKFGLLQAKTPTLQWFQEKRNITTRFPQRFCIHLIHLTSKIINYGENWTASIYSPYSVIKLASFFFFFLRQWKRLCSVSASVPLSMFVECIIPLFWPLIILSPLLFLMIDYCAIKGRQKKL